MTIYFLERLRKLLKSIGKKESKIDDLVRFKKFQKNIKNYQLDTNTEINKDNDEINNSIKIVASIAFFFDKNKISILNNVCKNLKEISNQAEIYIFTNQITSEQEENLKKNIEENVQIKIIDEILNPRLLPWYHINFMKKIYEERSEITHFLYLEDDISINKSNFNYWLNSRKILKKFNLIPGFVRIEKNKNDGELYAIDFVKEDKFKYSPKISIDENYFFINHKFPYQGMYLYDRELMKEHLYGPSSNPDCGHGAFNERYIDARMINLDLMAKANIGLTYLNVPEGFYSRNVLLFDKKKKIIDERCQIQHLSNKYSNTKSWFGNIKLKDAIK